MAQSITSADILKELNIKRSTFYYLLKNNLISIPTTDTGRYAWNSEVVEQLKIVLSEPQETEKEMPEVKTTKINNRRYLGNKYKLLDFITSTVARECVGVNTVADIFAGTGSVASAFADKKLITNDILYFNYICHIAWFGSEKYDESKIKELICYYNAIVPKQDNYMSLHFADTFFSLEDCRKIGFIREDIEDNYACGKINGRERALLITSLLYAMDKIANTCGHYDAYIKSASFDRHLELSLPLASNENNENNQCYNEDANNLVKRIVFIYKLAYISLLSEVLQYPIPIFCDSPSGREVEKSTIDGMLNILKRDYSHHQLVLASIYKYSEIFPKAKIIETNGTLFNKQTLFD